MKYYINDLLKTTLMALELILVFIFICFNYNFSVNYCNENDIPIDYVLVVSGINLVFAMTLILTIF